MATDNLKQVSKSLGKTRQETRQETRRFAQNLPIVEKSADQVGTLYTFRMDFYTYTDSPQVYIDVYFYPRFRTLEWLGVGNG
jgi:hypothetical protein